MSIAFPERITNPLSRSHQMGFRRAVWLRGGIRWYFRKGQRATMMHTLYKNGLLLGQ